MKKNRMIFAQAMFLILFGVLFASCNSEGCKKRGADLFQVDVFFYDYGDTYIASVRSELETELKKMSDTLRYTFYDGASDQTKQTTQVDTAITKGSDLLIVNVVTTGSDEAAQNIVNEAKEKQIPIIFFNREVSNAVVKSYDKCIFVGTDADQAGVMQGEMIATFLKEEGNLAKYDVDGDKKINYIMFRGELGNAEAFGRTLYSVKTANEKLVDSGYKLVPSLANQTDSTQPNDGISPYYLYGNWSATKAKDLMETALTSYKLDSGDIELVIANNDDQALGAIEALNEKNYNTGKADAKIIPTFGVDATEVAKDAIKNKKMVGTVKQDSTAMAKAIVDFVNDAKDKRDFDLSGYTVDEEVKKIRISYSIYLG
jgi:methyl-galactoside transport system substrate-binding protein